MSGKKLSEPIDSIERVQELVLSIRYQVKMGGGALYIPEMRTTFKVEDIESIELDKIHEK